jgi:hypothetical protein
VPEDDILRIEPRHAKLTAYDETRRLHSLGNLELKLDASRIPLGKYGSSFRVVTTVSESKDVRVAVTGYRTGAVEFKPARLVFTNAIAGSVCSRTVRLSPRGDWPADWVDDVTVVSTHAAVTGSIANPSSDSPHEAEMIVTIQVPATVEQRILTGEIRGERLNSEVFSIPFIAYCVDGDR